MLTEKSFYGTQSCLLIGQSQRKWLEQTGSSGSTNLRRGNQTQRLHSWKLPQIEVETSKVFGGRKVYSDGQPARNNPPGSDGEGRLSGVRFQRNQERVRGQNMFSSDRKGVQKKLFHKKSINYLYSSAWSYKCLKIPLIFSDVL